MSTATVSRTAPARTSWAGRTALPEQIAEWVARFHRDGYVFIDDVLEPERCAALRADFDRIKPSTGAPIEHHVAMFESSPANLALFDLEPMVSLAEAILSEDETYGAETCHVVHNNSFRTCKGGGWSHWHQDDSSHFKVTHGEPPTNIHLPCLLLTCNYYLTDQTSIDNGPGQVIPGSHLFGRKPPHDLSGTPWAEKVVTCTGRMGGVMVFNNQVWHRGAPNRSETTRYVTQVSYGRKSIAHFFAPFMGYRMPEHVVAMSEGNPRLKRLLGFLPNGPYG
ncbi:MAG: phytanoyl-CoA dioxygenase family protein [Planctomycetes bacterium]|nr:phytanoyl-CoA dioxygenase family protein [Planctomycetota bacterium]